MVNRVLHEQERIEKTRTASKKEGYSMTKHVAIVNGSLRKQSFNQSIVNYVKSVLEAKGCTVTQLNISNLPLMNQDIEFPAPAAVSAIRRRG